MGQDDQISVALKGWSKAKKTVNSLVPQELGSGQKRGKFSLLSIKSTEIHRRVNFNLSLLKKEKRDLQACL